jgi:hypothetical protein
MESTTVGQFITILKKMKYTGSFGKAVVWFFDQYNITHMVSKTGVTSKYVEGIVNAGLKDG